LDVPSLPFIFQPLFNLKGLEYEREKCSTWHVYPLNGLMVPVIHLKAKEISGEWMTIRYLRHRGNVQVSELIYFP
jgi:hypothetical protein